MCSCLVHTMFRRRGVLTLAVLLAAARCGSGATGATGVTAASDGCSNGNNSAHCFVCPETPSCPIMPEIPACPPFPQIPACPNMPEIPTCPGLSQVDDRPAETADPSPAHQASRELTCPECAACLDQAPSASAVTSLPLVPEGYQVVHGVRPYKLHTDRIGFHAANKTCAAEGGYLATPSTQAELNAILSLMSSHGVSNVHIGFHRSIKGTFIRITGEKMDLLQETLWATSEPNNGIQYNCAYLNVQDEKMRDQACTDREMFICEILM